MAETGESLKSLFADADQLRTQLDSLQASSEQYQTSLRHAIGKYEQCRDLLTKASIFSPNETLEDIPTADLKYLSVDYHLADLLARGFSGDRAQKLRNSQDMYTRFLNRLDDYELLNTETKKHYERFLEDKNSFTVLPLDPSARRNIKIARFQQEKDLEQKIQYLNSDPRILQDDDSAVRNLRLAELSLHTHETFQALDMVAQELKVLSMAPPPEANPVLPQDSRQSRRNEKENYSERLDMGMSSMLQNGQTGPLLSKSGRPLQPFTLLDSRERLRNGVFRPGHNLPTMTIDEYLEEEKRRGGIIEGGGEPPIVEPNEDDLEAADRETMKAREWDEFVEANPKGSGNTLNRG